jgi:flagellin
MPINDLTNKTLNSFELNNKKIQERQRELATGKKIDKPSDDPAGYTITEKLDLRSTALQGSFDNVGHAKNVLYTAESGYLSVNDILTQIKEKVVQARNASYSDDERQAIATEINQLAASIDDVVNTTKFNSEKLIGAEGLTGSFQVGADEGDEVEVDLSGAVDSGAFGLAGVSADDLKDGGLLDKLDSATDVVSGHLQNLGSTINRLSVKEENLSVAITNTDAATSRIRDVDVAKAQSALLQAQILQNSQVAQLSQANISAKSVNSL